MTTRTLLTLALTLCMVASPLLSQTGGYYISRTVTYPDALIATDPVPLNVPSNREEVAAIGMGKTQIANGREFNAMMYNPALLSHSRIGASLPDIQLGIPTESISAFNFLGNNIDEFRTGRFFRLINEGLADLRTAGTVDEQLAALQKIQDGLRFPAELQREVGGTIDNPRTHGVVVVPGFQLQIENWGFSLYGTSQTGFQLQSGEAVSRLSELNIPSTTRDLTPEVILNLLATVAPLFDEAGNLRTDALPEVYAMSYLDVVGAVGYAHPFSDQFSLGTSVKVVNRRFSTKRILVDDYDRIWNEARSEFEHSVTGVTADIGALWKAGDSGFELGVSLQNIIPLKQIGSTIVVPVYLSGIQDYDRDAFGNPIVTNGDTALVAAEQTVQVQVPFELDMPFVASIGSVYRVTDKWDLAFDWVDIAEQDSRYEETIDRIRLGSEYRLTSGDHGIGLAFRAGLSESRPTFGVGFNFFNFLKLDGAYAYEGFVGEPSYFAQIGFNW